MNSDIPVRPDGLQLDESRRFQRVSWAVQRAVWGVSLILALVALSGATGRGGPLAVTEQGVSESVVEAPRVTRRGSTDVMTVTFLRDAAEHRLILPDDLMRDFELQTVTPRPEREVTVAGGALLAFAAEGPPPHRATLHMRARHAGLIRPRLTVDGVDLHLSILILP